MLRAIVALLVAAAALLSIVAVLIVGFRLAFPDVVAQIVSNTDMNALSQQIIQLRNQGRYSEAIPLAQRVVAIQQKTLGPEHPDVATSLNNLAVLYRVQGRYTEAEVLYKRSLEITEKVHASWVWTRPVLFPV
jgi:tetratricopeptide (TPR) repeat protein